MRYLRCKCGKNESWSSMGSPLCRGCDECGTTLSQSPEGHKTPVPHQWTKEFNQSTGERENDVCMNCFEKRPASDEGLFDGKEAFIGRAE